MKKHGMVLLAAIITVFNPALAQTGKQALVPEFTIGLSDSSYFTRASLKKNTPLLLIYFLPDCGHCQQFSTELVQQWPKSGNLQAVMITNYSLSAVKQFEKQYLAGKPPGLKVGTEGKTYKIQREYQITSFPFVALFDKNGRGIAVYRQATHVKELLRKLYDDN